jgi:GNAT superfamily N-acetyltransferase
VRAARAKDRDAVVRLLEMAEALHAELQPRFFRSAAGPRRVFPADADEALLLAESVGVVCGLLRARVSESVADGGMVRARRALVEELVVDAEHRRRGCGRALLESAATWARGRGARQLVLTVWEGNDGAAEFYAALGYRRISQVLGTDL